MVKVLIVEDDILVGDILETFLVSAGYDVCGVALSVDEAVMLADLHQPDLAVLDFRLADGGYGPEIKSRLKNPSGLGILYATGDGMNKGLTSKDGDAFIQKPYQMKDIIKCLEIVQKLRTTGVCDRVEFPRNFVLLKDF